MSDFDVRSTSPADRYIVGVDSFEARASQWVDTPDVFDTVGGRMLLALSDRYWHPDLADWQSESVVVLQLRHFPHPHAYSCTVVVDCERLNASLNGAEPLTLGQLDDILDRAYIGGAAGVVDREP
jgi:hypothetical protein